MCCKHLSECLSENYLARIDVEKSASEHSGNLEPTVSKLNDSVKHKLLKVYYVFICSVMLLLSAGLSQAETPINITPCDDHQNRCKNNIIIACAANFTPAMKELVSQFRQIKAQELNIKIVSGSSGKLTTQILQGAPFDLFFSADRSYVDLLVEANVVDKPSRQTYAIGQLALITVNPTIQNPYDALKNGQFNKLSIANPRLAPYGSAALSVIESIGGSKPVEDKLLQAENVSQAFQFVASANADLGFVSTAQLHIAQQNHPDKWSSPYKYWLVPTSMHPAIRQDVIKIERSQTTETGKIAHQFLHFLSSPSAQAIIRRYGYLSYQDTVANE